EPVHDAVAERHPEAAVIIPPRRTAVPGETATTQRDRHLATIAKHGRMNWQRTSGYNRRSLAETGVFRYKAIIGRRLHARTLPNRSEDRMQRSKPDDRTRLANLRAGSLLLRGVG